MNSLRTSRLDGRVSRLGYYVVLCGLSPVALMAGAPRIERGVADRMPVALTREAKAAIELSQQWLAGQQRSDGSFHGDWGTGPGIVGSGVLALMVNGNLPGEGRYGKQVAKGVDYIIRSAEPSGLFKARKGVMYQHGLATICLAEVWGQTQDKRIYDVLKKAVELIIRCQNDRGGWRYQPRPTDDDLSVTVMQLMALYAARDAGMPVPREVVDLAVRYVASCRTPKDKAGMAGFAYKPGEGKRWSTTAAGVTGLLMCGRINSRLLRNCLDYLVHVRSKKQDRKYFLYGHYYAALAMKRAGAKERDLSKYWTDWYPGVSKQLVALQVKSGPYRGSFKKPAHGYGIWSTAMGVLILGAPYRYLPIYQR